ncbi:MAG TPA: rhodanese-like domain-containing protein [Symbiobacteriaceae bacterium]|nr:rhodanese-like domain-containing protein [Symbiobacteriaceae bacterium]
MKRLFAAALTIVMLTAVGCSKPSATYQKPGSAAPTTAPAQPASTPVGPKGDGVNISAEDFLKKFKAGEKMLVIDVRTEEEYGEGHVPGSKLVPLQTIEQGIEKYPKEQEIYLICRSGNRSAQAYTILRNMGYTKLHNVVGGVEGYKKLGGILEL